MIPEYQCAKTRSGKFGKIGKIVAMVTSLPYSSVPCKPTR